MFFIIFIVLLTLEIVGVYSAHWAVYILLLAPSVVGALLMPSFNSSKVKFKNPHDIDLALRGRKNNWR